MSCVALIALLELADYDAGQVLTDAAAKQLQQAGLIMVVDNDPNCGDGHRYCYITDEGKTMAQLLLATAAVPLRG